MELFSPNRPQLGFSCKAILNTNLMIPSFYLDFIAKDKIRLTLWLLANDKAGGYKAYNHDLHPDYLSDFIKIFMADPEEILKEVFHWEPQKLNNFAQSEALVTTPTLDE